VCYFVGKIVGAVAQHTIDENIKTYKRENPIPVDPVTLSQDGSVNVDIIVDDSQAIQATEFKEPASTRSAA